MNFREADYFRLEYPERLRGMFIAQVGVACKGGGARTTEGAE